MGFRILEYSPRVTRCRACAVTENEAPSWKRATVHRTKPPMNRHNPVVCNTVHCEACCVQVIAPSAAPTMTVSAMCFPNMLVARESKQASNKLQHFSSGPCRTQSSISGETLAPKKIPLVASGDIQLSFHRDRFHSH